MPLPNVRTQSTNNLTLETLPDRVKPIAATYVRASTTVTVTSTAHGLVSGREIAVISATDTGLLSGSIPSKWPTVTVTNANTFTFVTSSTGATSGSLSYVGNNIDADQIDSDPSLPA